MLHSPGGKLQIGFTLDIPHPEVRRSMDFYMTTNILDL
jgi:hypothetical protein